MVAFDGYRENCLRLTGQAMVRRLGLSSSVLPSVRM